MLTRYPTFLEGNRGRTGDQKAAVQLMERGAVCFIFQHWTQYSTFLPVFSTQLQQMQTLTLALWKRSHTPWKPSIKLVLLCTVLLGQF